MTETIVARNDNGEDDTWTCSWEGGGVSTTPTCVEGPGVCYKVNKM